MQVQNNNLLLLILCLGVFGILSTELGMMGIIPIVSQKFDVSIADAGWTLSVFALTITFCAPIVPLLCSGFEKKKLMLLSLGVFSLSSLLCIFVSEFWLLLVLRAGAAFFHPIYIALALNLASTCVEDSKDIPKAIAKVFAGVSAGMVLGVPITAYLGGELSFEAAMGFFFFCNTLTLLATLIFIPQFPKSGRIKLTQQFIILKEPLLLTSILAVIFINGGIWGFYGYFSDFLHTLSQVDFTHISFILFIYGFSNIIGNVLAGKALVKNANLTLKITPFVMIFFYTFIFMSATEFWILLVLMFLLGILGGIMNNATHFMISHPYPNAPELTNGLFLSVANIGLFVGTGVCGLFITFYNTRFIALAAILLLLGGILSIFIRSKITKSHTGPLT